ncbi:MAG: hypothetical protein AAF564_17830 [Bacteroidota bacterium]
MPIIRKKRSKDQPYVVLRKTESENTALSWAARGLLIYLMGLPVDAEITLESLTDQSPGSDAENRELIKELIDAGYLDGSL